LIEELLMTEILELAIATQKQKSTANDAHKAPTNLLLVELISA
jgi:hypothetical protein